MKPIAHPLAIEIVGRMSRKEDIGELFPEWRNLGSPLYVAPTPLPAPALGMRVWTETAPLPGKRQTRHEDIEWLKDGDRTWGEGTMPPAAEVAIITDYRTGDVLWRRQ